jgi:hypothetical protein
MAYSKAKLRSSGDKAYHVLDHFGQKNYQKNIYVNGLYSLFHLNTFNQPNFKGIPNSMRILYNTSLLTESWAFLKSMNS